METKSFSIPAMPMVDFSIAHRVLDKNSPLNQNEPHIHNECEIYLNLSGDVSFEVEKNIYPISRGSVIITRPLEYHRCIYRSEEKHEHFWITFSGEERVDFLEMFFGREQGKNNLIILDETQLKECLSALEVLLINESNTLQRRIAFCRMLYILSKGEWTSSVECIEKMPQDVAMALRFIDEHLTEEFEIRAVSDFCNVSVNTLERHFKKVIGLTPYAMLRKKRLLASMDFLRKGETVTDAAIKSGFSDYSNYIQLFRKQFGLTPLQYKKKFVIK